MARCAGDLMLRLLAAAVLVCSVCGVSLAAQEDAQPGDPAPAAGRASPERAARALARAALLDLRVSGDNSPGRMMAAERALGIALQLSPDDQELSRLRLEAAYGADYRKGVRDETRRLIRLDPKDTVAQLRLIATRIADLNTAEERIEAYERYLSAGDKLDPSVRSRLAMDAALMYREFGDDAKFGEKLREAMRLDSTNKEAASLAWSFFSERVDDRAGRLQLLSNLLLADPLDANVQRWMAGELAAAGAWAQAQRMHANAQVLFGMDDRVRARDLELERMALRWAAEGPGPIVDEMEKRLASLKFGAESQVKQYERAEQALPEDFVGPEDTRLGLNVELLRHYAALDARNRETVLRSRSDLRSTTGQLMDAAVAAQNENQQDLEQQRQLAGQWQNLGLIMLRALVLGEAIEKWPARVEEPEGEEADGENAEEGVEEEADVDDAEAVLAETDAGAIIEARAITSLILGSLPEALAADEELAGFEGLLTGVDVVEMLEAAAVDAYEPEWSLLGLAIAQRDVGEFEDAKETLFEVVERAPLGVTAGVARSIARTIEGFELFPEDERSAAASVGDGVPLWVDQMVRSPSSFMTFSIVAERSTVRADEANPLTIRLRNTARVPLAVGPDRPLNSEVMFSPRVTVGAVTEHDLAYPEVYGLERRLRLEPGEELAVTVSPDLGFNWWIMERVLSKPVRSRWRAIQGFQVSNLQLFEAGPHCLSSQTTPLARLPVAEALLSVGELAEEIRTQDESRVEMLAIATKASLIGPEGSVEGATTLADAWVERFGSLSDEAQTIALAILPTARMAPGMDVLDTSLTELAGPGAFAAALVTRRTTAIVDAAAAYAEANGDELLGDLAERYRADVAEGAPSGYAGADASLGGYGSLRGVVEEIKAEQERQERRERR